ncbi:hypothetical protein M407DRAFT_30414 [Tulasnella calospora MUT 4182]|uniref:Uncharacterized protein n=1 Tax=Tulasnella calospora MUT 4182 TaxID=1051891 RepID=A0A0C3KEQ8_9AGAM|nr:hypothetical protein M407DRAFT_30414 [Tulasnella calospora MUT 4182]
MSRSTNKPLRLQDPPYHPGLRTYPPLNYLGLRDALITGGFDSPRQDARTRTDTAGFSAIRLSVQHQQADAPLDLYKCIVLKIVLELPA